MDQRKIEACAEEWGLATHPTSATDGEIDQ
jgi:hypothetical protein